jgi:hypothetical protein
MLFKTATMNDTGKINEVQNILKTLTVLNVLSINLDAAANIAIIGQGFIC